MISVISNPKVWKWDFSSRWFAVCREELSSGEGIRVLQQNLHTRKILPRNMEESYRYGELCMC